MLRSHNSYKHCQIKYIHSKTFTVVIMASLIVNKYFNFYKYRNTFWKPLTFFGWQNSSWLAELLVGLPNSIFHGFSRPLCQYREVSILNTFVYIIVVPFACVYHVFVVVLSHICLPNIPSFIPVYGNQYIMTFEIYFWISFVSCFYTKPSAWSIGYNVCVRPSVCCLLWRISCKTNAITCGSLGLSLSF